jgi:hypothetical protein
MTAGRGSDFWFEICDRRDLSAGHSDGQSGNEDPAIALVMGQMEVRSFQKGFFSLGALNA